ncbi:MAG: hypothetical protein ISS49_02035 [Anaerolineae bacterium]|nr:hypothetical protein [Anaerolineae bacterium]
MVYELASVEQEAVLRELRQVFDETTTEVLGRVLGRMAARAEEVRVTREGFRELRATVAELAEAQRRTERAVHGLEGAMRGLAEAQRQTDVRLGELAEAQVRTENGLQRLEETVRELAGAQIRTAQDVAAVKGRQLELTYQQRAGAYFGPLLRRVRAFLPVELEEELEARLSREEFRDLLRLDLLVRGRPRYREEAPEVWLAVEVSAVVDRHDVERALRRAGYLRQAGYCAIPTVTGERATEGAVREGETHKVLMLLDGQVVFWEEALDAALS